MTEKNQEKIRSIIFFDGYCGLCNSFINFMLLLVKRKNIYFSTLQGETAKEVKIFTDKKIAPESIIFFSNGKIYHRSEAVIQIFIQLGGLGNLAILAKIFPLFFRDFIYNFVARNRYSWFGKYKICRLPSKEEKKFFLP